MRSFISGILVCLLTVAVTPSASATIIEARAPIERPTTSHHEADPGPVAAPRHRPASKTRITLNVRGCPGCRIQAVQNLDGDLTYVSKNVRVRNGRVTWTVPTTRTRSMAFVVDAPFDDFGYPVVVATGFRAKPAGTRIPPTYPRDQRWVSGCWAGTQATSMTNTLRVRKVRLRNTIIGPRLRDSAAGYLQRTLPSTPHWHRTRHAAMHASDPSICE